MSVSESTRLLAPGVEVVLGDGKAYVLKFDWRAIQQIETDLGSLEQAISTINGAGFENRRVTAIGSLMAATLAHTRMKPDQVLDLLDFKQIVSYITALAEAFQQAMPESTGEDSPNVEGSESSPGNGSITSPPSATDVAMTSSGG